MTFRGTDVLHFLQGYFTCDCEQLTPETLQAAAICNLQGRVVVHGWCYLSAQDSVTWLIHHSLEEILLQFMKPYLAFSKTQLVGGVGDDCLILGCLGSSLSANLAKKEIAPGLSIQVLTAVDEVQSALSTHQPIVRERWDAALIERKVLWLSSANSGRFLPQMLGLLDLGAIDFDKGCYLGQEVVARAQHRGKVKRTLHRLQWTGSTAPEIGGDILNAGGKTVGSVLQVAAVPPRCLAVVQADAESPFSQAGSELRSW